MHVPDGFFDTPTTVSVGVVAVAGVVWALRGFRRELGDRTIPLAGLVAVFAFAVQWVSVPIAAGTNAHLLGGVLAAVLLGPHIALLCMTVVLLAQTVVLAYGGLAGLGASFVVMDLVPIAVGYAVFLLLRRLLPAGHRGCATASAVGAFVSALAGAFTFAGLYAVGGAAGIPLRTVAGAVTGAHALTGLVEGAVTALGVSAVLAVRPELVRAAALPARPPPVSDPGQAAP